MKKMLERDRINHFLSKVKMGGPDECWEWQAGKVSGSYGKFFDGKRNILAHRFAYEIFIGEIPNGFLVRHSCDNPPCCNPSHLLPGTDADNSRDMIERGRRVNHIGSDHGMAILTEEEVINIRTRYAEDRITQYELGIEYGVSKPTIGHITRRETWRHI